MIEALDLRLDEAGDLDLSDEAAHLVYWDEVGIAQRIQTRLRLNLGEYVLDVTAGVPWTQQIFTKGIDTTTIEAILRRQILLVPGVIALESMSASLDPMTRHLTFTFRALCTVLETGLEDSADTQMAVVAGDGFLADGQVELLCLVEGVGGYV